MATAEATQAVLGTQATSPRILKYVPDASKTNSYVVGGAAYPGKARWITTNTSDNDATQGAAILAGLL
jgi:hypothetical protein